MGLAAAFCRRRFWTSRSRESSASARGLESAPFSSKPRFYGVILDNQSATSKPLSAASEFESVQPALEWGALAGLGGNVFPLGLKLGCRATGERDVCPTARRALDVSPRLLFVLPLLGYRRSVVSQLDDRVITAIERHASEGRATARSDWDFIVETDDFAAVATDLPNLCAPLAPVAQQWDRLSSRYCWMLILSGPVKIDLIFADQPHERESPWVETAANLTAIDRHFWDWTLWLSGKAAVGKSEIVASELDKLFEHILAPLGVERRPSSVAEAVTAYRTARRRAEERFGCHVPRELETAVAPALPK
jgi:hypothetical protein